MNSKIKLIATIMTMCLVITLGVIGIFAVKSLNMSVGGNITFSADGLALEVSAGQFKTTGGAEYANITTQTGKLQGFEIDTNTKLSDIQSKIDSWKNLELKLDEQGDAVLHFRVTNKMTTSLYVYISIVLGTNTNDNMDLIVSPNGTEILPSKTTDFEITFDILDTNINAGLAGFEIGVDFSKENVVKVQNKIDVSSGLETNEVDYYYVEMGTYNGKVLRWRYVSNIAGENFDNIKKLNGIRGYYVLDTNVLMTHSFFAGNSSNSKHITEGCENININDYGLSSVRKYLRNTGVGGFLETIGITENDIIYSLIKGRTLADLYSNIQRNGYAIGEENLSYSLSLKGEKSISNEIDKLWLMSQSEVKTFFPNQEDRIFSGNYYRLRSPHTYPQDACTVSSNGGFDYSTVGAQYTLRPCFMIG